jgi:hypothetical protein
MAQPQGLSRPAALFHGGDSPMPRRQQMCCALVVAQFGYNVNRGHWRPVDRRELENHDLIHLIRQLSLRLSSHSKSGYPHELNSKCPIEPRCDGLRVRKYPASKIYADRIR